MISKLHGFVRVSILKDFFFFFFLTLRIHDLNKFSLSADLSANHLLCPGLLQYHLRDFSLLFLLSSYLFPHSDNRDLLIMLHTFNLSPPQNF